MTGGIPQQATDTHLNTDLQSHGKEEIWSCGGNFMKFEVLLLFPRLQMCGLSKQSWSDFFSVIGGHVTKYPFTCAGLEECLKKANASAASEVFHFLSSSTAWIFPFYFQLPLPAWRNLFSASWIFCGGRYQPGCIGIFWPAEGTSQPVAASKKWNNPSSTLRSKRTWVQALPWFSTRSLSLPALDTDLKSQKGLYSGPSRRNTPLFFLSFFFFLWYPLGIRGYQGFSDLFQGTRWVSGYNRVSEEKCRGLVFVQGLKASAQAFTHHKNRWERGL
jgi:hypothetical protein